MERDIFKDVDSLEIIAKMTAVSELTNRINNKFYKNFKLTRIQFRTLYFLNMAGDEGYKLSELSKKLNIANPTCSNLVDRMASAGLVCRYCNKLDRRSIKVLITSDGKKIIEKLFDHNENFKKQILSFLTEDEKKTFFYLLNKIQNNLEEKYL